MELLTLRPSRKSLLNYNLWILIAITLFLIFVYQAWPWRHWIFTGGLWLWFGWLSPLYKLAIFESLNHFVGVLFFIPIIYSVIALPWQGSLLISLLSLAGILPISLDLYRVNNLLATNIIFIILPFLIVSLINIELKWRARERKLFTEREAERQMYMAKIIEFQEKERKRLAQELHDDTIQTLVAVASYAEAIESPTEQDTAEMKKCATWIRGTTLHTIGELRRICADLRPSILDNVGLLPALRWLVDQINRESDIRTQLVIEGTKRKLPSSIEIAVFRVIQEALNNIKHHSEATEANIKLFFNPNTLNIIIQDNGQGFNQPESLPKFANEGKLGLIGIHERIISLGGTFEVNSKLGSGTELLIALGYGF
jgi:two-component system, NarL family, sensor histidine kinase DegS